MAIKRANQRKKNKIKSTPIKRQIVKWTLRIIGGFFALTIFWVLLLMFMNPPITYLQLQRAFERKAAGKDWKIDKEWLDYKDISDNLKRAALAGEDAHFMTHNGFDTKAIKEAIAKNKEGKKLRGGSTISQQVAKNVFLWPERSWLRKGLETYFTVLIEIFWSKKRILEVYLNVIEMGQGVYGAEAASRYYFHKSGKSLTKKEAALIIAILPSPQKWDARNPSNYVNRRANNIVRYLNYYSIPE
ncbi:monofunctional biosynthetic peptidoglycan transglycosylase [Sphingobacterium alkalisoli]|uniref:Biosynthetic peptidoglycan transglycosylase n=1 Tax=Sphingobacterium alkalisoli TaxID=1874115 RepID=A0A4U0GYM3_9SPHI|nr:monofunctional biosynthetic peptidoglycan transglycosylase [Sphingobacterium alkalisoli]TJY64305.1 monofunctional biosynthetic peptidoglycan transglycosylase [Sphingobacterium alkalisoli]GGH22551.1 monofunctional biosynthetic peptidoglycan transglycosylase [Sphingobacterium alkalisoli]